MVRKSFVAALILLYSASTVGLPLHFHYCMGELRHVSLLVKMSCHDEGESPDVHACCKTNQTDTNCYAGPSMKSCCDDATQWVQDNLPAILAKDLEIELGPALYTTIGEELTLPDAGQLHPTLRADTGAPPGPPIYLLDCSLIYYG